MLMNMLSFKHDDYWDTSGMAHIYIAQNRRHPPANTDRDLRRYPDIVKDGLDGKHNFIENIKPLAQTMMHELLHAVGGCKFTSPLLELTLALHNCCRPSC